MHYQPRGWCADVVMLICGHTCCVKAPPRRGRGTKKPQGSAVRPGDSMSTSRPGHSVHVQLNEWSGMLKSGPKRQWRQQVQRLQPLAHALLQAWAPSCLATSDLHRESSKRLGLAWAAQSVLVSRVLVSEAIPGTTAAAAAARRCLQRSACAWKFTPSGPLITSCELSFRKQRARP